MRLICVLLYFNKELLIQAVFITIVGWTDVQVFVVFKQAKIRKSCETEKRNYYDN